VHEAGHAVVALALRRNVETVTILRSGHMGGFVDSVYRRTSAKPYRELPTGEFERRSPAELLAPATNRARDQIVILLAGAEAERQIVPALALPDGDKVDLETIAQFVADAARVGESSTDVMQWAGRRTAALVQRHRVSIFRVAIYLVSNETLTGREVRTILGR
jgi:hypothetical protein